MTVDLIEHLTILDRELIDPLYQVDQRLHEAIINLMVLIIVLLYTEFFILDTGAVRCRTVFLSLNILYVI